MNKINETLLNYKASEKDEGKTTEHILKKNFKISSGLFKELKLNGKIYLNNKICRSVDIVHIGDSVSADIEENIKSDIPEYDMKLNILFEDAHILVAEKPAELSMHPCIANYENTFAGAVIKHYRSNGEQHSFHAVNRLDKDTSGICIIAKNRYSHGSLSMQLKNSLLKKEYKAVVHGRITKAGVIALPLIRDDKSILKRVVSNNGKEAVTEYFPTKCGDEYSLIGIRLRTGRTHQIRVHFSHIGNPLFGDWLYGFGDNEKEFIHRQALHSSSVTFFHPVSGEPLSFVSKLPEDINCLLEKLK